MWVKTSDFIHVRLQYKRCLLPADILATIEVWCNNVGEFGQFWWFVYRFPPISELKCTEKHLHSGFTSPPQLHVHYSSSKMKQLPLTRHWRHWRQKVGRWFQDYWWETSIIPDEYWICGQKMNADDVMLLIGQQPIKWKNDSVMSD